MLMSGVRAIWVILQLGWEMRGRICKNACLFFYNKIYCYAFKISLICYIHLNESLKTFRFLNNFNQTLVTQQLMSVILK